jgi:hypothetical protein
MHAQREDKQNEFKDRNGDIGGLQTGSPVVDAEGAPFTHIPAARLEGSG